MKRPPRTVVLAASLISGVAVAALILCTTCLLYTSGTKVELYVPQRGDVAKLVTMAYTNAVERLGRESGRYTSELVPISAKVAKLMNSVA